MVFSHFSQVNETSVCSLLGEGSEVDFDYALLKISFSSGNDCGIEFNDYVQPACLPKANTDLEEGSECSISGWGEMADDGK